MKHRHRRFLLRGAILPCIENTNVVCSDFRQPRLMPSVHHPLPASQTPHFSLFNEVEALERAAVSTAEIRLLLLSELAHLKQAVRVRQRAGTCNRIRQGHLVQQVRLFLDRLPSPRSVEQKRHRQGARIYRCERETWKDYVDERRWRDEFEERMDDSPILELPDFYQLPHEPIPVPPVMRKRTPRQRFSLAQAA